MLNQTFFNHVGTEVKVVNVSDTCVTIQLLTGMQFCIKPDEFKSDYSPQPLMNTHVNEYIDELVHLHLSGA